MGDRAPPAIKKRARPAVPDGQGAAVQPGERLSQAASCKAPHTPTSICIQGMHVTQQAEHHADNTSVMGLGLPVITSHLLIHRLIDQSKRLTFLQKIKKILNLTNLTTNCMLVQGFRSCTLAFLLGTDIIVTHTVDKHRVGGGMLLFAN